MTMKNKKAITILMILAVALPMGALAEDMILEDASYTADVQILPEAELVIEESTAASHRVTFYDLTGCELESQDVQEGCCATAPVLADAAIASWYDETSETREAFDFNTPVYGAINLYAQRAEEIIIADEIIVSEETLGQSILDMVEVAPVETNPEIIAASILGATTPEVVTEPQANPVQILTIDDLIGTPATETETTTNVQIDEMAVINDILAAGNAAISTSTETNNRSDMEQNAVMDILAAQNTSSNDELFEIKDEIVPLAAPVAAPSVEVVCDYDGTLTAGTQVTVRAIVHNLPDAYSASFQWQNDASGSFQDVAGATGETFTFTVGEFGNDGCNWRVNVDLFN